jgi:hypothetical protein
MQNAKWLFDRAPGNDDEHNDAAIPETPEDAVDFWGIRAALMVLCIALFMAAMWVATQPSFEKCSAITNVTDRDACYDTLRTALFKAPAKGGEAHF